MADPQPNTEPREEEEDVSRAEEKEEQRYKLKSKAWKWVEECAVTVWENLQKNHLWQRMFKSTLATTIAIIIALIPAVLDIYGRATYLAPITTVFGHPGRRFGQMAEALVLALFGTLVGIAWSTLGIYLSSLVYANNAPAAYTVRGVFLVVAVIVHGLLRSHTPRLFIGVLLMIIVCVVSLTNTVDMVSAALVTTLLYPILTAVGILLLDNLLVFPEFSSSFLGITTIETLGDTVGALRDAGKYFISIGDSLETQALSKDVACAPEAEPSVAAEAPPDSTEPKSSTPSSFDKLMRSLHIRTTKDGEKVKPEAKLPERVKLKSLTDDKAKLRAKLAGCKAAQQECNFELTFAVLPPRDLKVISDTAMKKLVANTIALIGACESKYALMGDEEDEDEQKKSEESAAPSVRGNSRRPSLTDESGTDEKEKEQSEEEKLEEKPGEKLERKQKKNKGKTRLEREIADLEAIKPRKEIEFGDIELLRLLVKRISQSIVNLQEKLDRSVDVITSCLAYCYDVPKLPNGSMAPKGVRLDEIDIWADVLTASIADFDAESALALEGVAALQNLDNTQVDIMPRMETFLISSFLLNLRQAALRTHEMLAHSRKLVEKRQVRHGRRRIYAPRINWRKWLTSGGEEDEQALPPQGRRDRRTGTMKESSENDEDAGSSEGSLLLKKEDEETGKKTFTPPPPEPKAGAGGALSKPKENRTTIDLFRNKLADMIEYTTTSEDVLYAIKLVVAVFLVTWPAFLSSWNTWYSLNRGLWAALQLILITEVAIGSSVSVFILRAFGTTLGCVWGLAAYEAGGGGRVVCVVMLAIGIVPSTYVQLGTPYVKAGMVSIVSMCIVALATVDQTTPGTAVENFSKRLIAFLIGAVVALVVEFTLFPVKARDRLVESVAASIRQITEMEACLAYGIETECNVDVHSPEVSERFDNAKSKAQVALAAAETFLPFCAQEPRLKGSFAGLALVYTEILYVLHQIVDRMDNMLQLGKEYGSGVLEELNVQVYPYRRNIAGSITLILFAVHEALTTKLPLPQFLPSARLAHLRMVNRVREVVLNKVGEPAKGGKLQRDQGPESIRSQMELSLVKRIVQKKFLSWNAATAGQTEVIEYLEELIDLTKLLVGANEFRSGMLTRPTFREYVERIGEKHNDPELEPNKTKTGSRWDLEVERERVELSNSVPTVRKPTLTKEKGPSEEDTRKGPAATKKRSTHEAERQKKNKEDELPMSLQRVRTRRVEDRNERVGKVASRRS